MAASCITPDDNEKRTRWDDVCPLILAAGKGKRMGNGHIPKVLCSLHGESLIEHLLEHVEASKLTIKPVVVVGYGGEHVRGILGDRVTFVEQGEQLGTGHAVRAAEKELRMACGHVLVLYGDHPYVPSYIINELVSLHKGQSAVITMCVTHVSDFEAWRKDLYAYGRVVRNQAGAIAKIVEMKDATPQELAIRELNVGYYCFEASWLWEHLPQLGKRNAQGEYYLTDLIEMALSGGQKVQSLAIDPLMSIGVNTPEQLEQAEKLLFRKK